MDLSSLLELSMCHSVSVVRGIMDALLILHDVQGAGTATPRRSTFATCEIVHRWTHSL